MTGADDAGSTPAGVQASDQARMAFILHLRERGIADVNVLRALETVPRELFVPRRYVDLAWRDIALPIACGQIMPHPYVVARTVEALALTKQHRVLEIGAGSGYTTAILSRLSGEVVSFERYRTLAVEAQARLRSIGVENVEVTCADGFDVVSGLGAFDRIVVHLALADEGIILSQHLKEGGRMVCGRAESADSRAGLVLIFHGEKENLSESPVVAGRFSSPLQGRSMVL